MPEPARMVLPNRMHRREIEANVAKVEKIKTALERHFQQLFVHTMAMPNRVDAFPKLVKALTLPERRVVEMAADGSSGRRGGRRR